MAFTITIEKLVNMDDISEYEDAKELREDVYAWVMVLIEQDELEFTVEQVDL